MKERLHLGGGQEILGDQNGAQGPDPFLPLRQVSGLLGQGFLELGRSNQAFLERFRAQVGIQDVLPPTLGLAPDVHSCKKMVPRGRAVLPRRNGNSPTQSARLRSLDTPVQHEIQDLKGAHRRFHPREHEDDDDSKPTPPR